MVKKTLNRDQSLKNVSSPEVTHTRKSMQTSIQRHPRPRRQAQCLMTWDRTPEVRQRRRVGLPHWDRRHHLDHHRKAYSRRHRRTFERLFPLLRRFLKEVMQKPRAKPLAQCLLPQQLQTPKSLTIRTQRLQKIYVANSKKIIS